jgi:hypothetical protein
MLSLPITNTISKRWLVSEPCEEELEYLLEQQEAGVSNEIQVQKTNKKLELMHKKKT